MRKTFQLLRLIPVFALEATIVSHHLLLPNSDDQLVVDAYTIAEKSGAHIVNSSFGLNPFRNGGTLTNAQVENELASASFRKVMLPAASADSFNANMLFIFSAGNYGLDCAAKLTVTLALNGAMHDCRVSGKALLKLRQTEAKAGDRIIFVSSLIDGSNHLAGYSLHAGQLKNDFILAHDDIYRAGDGRGTSFAAPRVAGAAALVRQKFPSLDGVQLKQVILRSADDLGPKGVDAYFGYGKLNVMSALSPLGGLTK